MMPAKEIERPAPLKAIEECRQCFDLGIVRVRSINDQAESLMLCDCAEGGRQTDNFPRWTYQWSRLYERKRCPVEWFKPKSEGPIFVKGEFSKDVDRKIADWKARREIARMYWEHQRSTIVVETI